MRELAFDLGYERGVDRIGDVFIDHPKVKLTSLACVGTRDHLWRLDRVTGTAAGVTDFETALSEGDASLGCPGTVPDGEYYAEILARQHGRWIVYSRHQDGDSTRSIPILAVRHFGDGLLFHNERAGNRTRWQVVMPNGVDVGAFCRDVRSSLSDGVTFDFGYVGRASGWESFAGPTVTISPEQRAALDAAAEHGYYEQPRGIELDDLAASLDIPRSTLSYRLRRAEAELAEAFLSR